jgi:hypothetical protein
MYIDNLNLGGFFMELKNIGITPQQNLNIQKKGNPEKPDPNAPVDVYKPLSPKELLESPGLHNLLANSLKAGESLTISTGHNEIITVRKEGKPSKVGAVVSRSAELMANAIKSTPSGAFQISTSMAKEIMLKNIPSPITKAIDANFFLVLRAGATVIDGFTTYRTMRNRDARMEDKVLEGIHLATDVIGLVGAAGYYGLIPALSGPAAIAMLATGFLGDLGSFGYHIKRYAEEKGEPLPIPSTQGNTAATTSTTSGQPLPNTTPNTTPNT